ncbi:MAG: tRNA 2-thiouridine(34) synthase MnmA [Planctomycetes bacterium]|nr:tRNA 2-thiouridine(34) synthase MnmA [Planctomycetota bacterium]
MRVVVAMSGGVDSSASAYLLQQQGHEVIGLFMRSGVSVGHEGGRGCCTAEDARDAQAVAAHLHIPFYAVNFEAEFRQLIKDFVDEYDRGRTPNPCVQCNRLLKFGHLLHFARQLDAGGIATGHYARLETRDGRVVLRRGVDAAKDQSYVLFNLSQAQLGAVRLPVGDLPKERVRDLARRAGLKVCDKPDSQDICFVPTGDYRDTLRAYAGDRLAEGPIVDEGGRVVGRHGGVQLYTIGQRHGLRVALGEPRYVVRLDRAANTVHIGPREHLLRSECSVSQVNWVSIDRPDQPVRCQAQIRYHHAPAAATVCPVEGDRARVVFDRPQAAVTPGQASVFYDADLILGGGWIDA